MSNRQQSETKPRVEFGDSAWVNAIVQENDPRGGTVKRVMAVRNGYAECHAGRDGSGRKSRVAIVRLYTGRYSLLGWYWGKASR